MHPLILTAIAVTLAVLVAAVASHRPTTRTPDTSARSWFVLGAHDIRSTLPAAIRPIVQDGLLDRTFQDALVSEFLFPGTASVRPWSANMGDTQTFTRTGLLTPTTTPLGGSDPSADTYGVEQYSMTMDQYGNSVDTNMLQSAVALASKFLEDGQKLGINAGQSVNRIARNKLYAAYAGGRTFAAADEAGGSTDLVVDDVTGFTHVLVNGVPTPVSGSNPLAITLGGVSKSVTAVDTGTNTLTIASSTWSEGDAVVATNAPFSLRAGAGDSAFDLTSANVATFSLFRDAVARLRTNNVPTIGGAYVAHIDPTTEAQLFGDSEFQNLYAGAVESPVWRDMSIGRFGGIDWVRNNEARTDNNGTLDYHQPIVVGGDAFVAGPFENMGSLLAEAPEEASGSIRMVPVGLEASPLQVALIVRPPQDRLQQVVSSSWSFVGDFAVPSDSTTGGSSTFKRAVVIEHA